MAEQVIVIQTAFHQYECELGLIGRIGENISRKIVFDCSEVLADGANEGQDQTTSIACVCSRPDDVTPYPIELIADGTDRYFLPTRKEVAKEGTITLELRAINGDRIVKSAFFYGRVEKSLTGEADARGEPMHDALDRLAVEMENAKAVVEAANTAEAKREKAENKRETAFSAALSATNAAAANAQAKADDADMAAANANKAATEANAGEENRAEAEAARASAEAVRMSAEQARVNAENLRAAAEIERTENEARRMAA